MGCGGVGLVGSSFELSFVALPGGWLYVFQRDGKGPWAKALGVRPGQLGGERQLIAILGAQLGRGLSVRCSLSVVTSRPVTEPGVQGHALPPPGRCEIGDSIRSLTRREQQVVDLAADGMSSKRMASVLQISRRTVESHVANAYRKLGVQSRAQLIAHVGRGLPHAVQGSPD